MNFIFYFSKIANLFIEIKSAIVVFLVSGAERNIGDQRLLEYKCKELNSNIKIFRYCLEDFAAHGALDEKKRLIM